MKQVIRYTVVILLTLGGLLLLWEFREAIVLFLLSLALAAAFRPPVELLIARKFPRVPAILLTYFVGIAFLFLLIYLISGPLTRELQQATDNFAVAYTLIQEQWSEGNQFQQAIAGQLPPLETLYGAVAGEQGAAFFQTVVGFAANLFALLSGLAIVLALSLYWSADRVHFERLWLSLLPAGRRSRAREIWRDIEQGVGAYIRSEVFQAILAGLLLGTAYSLLGLRYPTLLALLGALAWLIPWLGAVLAVIPPLVIGLGEGLWLGLAAALVTLAVLVLMEMVVEKRFFDRRRYSSILLVLTVIALADVMGLIGILIAPPLAAAIQIAGSRLLAQPVGDSLVEPETSLTGLRTRLERVKGLADELNEAPPHIANLIHRLDRLIEETEEAL